MKKYSLYTIVLVMVIVLSGCSLNSSGSAKNVGGIIKSTDSGSSWEIKNKVDENTSISAVDVITIAIDPADSEKIYLGTKNKGLLISENSAEEWDKFNFPTEKNVYGVAVDYFNSQIIYASGTIGNKGKVFKTEDGGENWKEVYTEPAEGTYITAMAMNANDPKNIFVGTSKGVIIRTSDGGVSWDNLYSYDGAVSKIMFSNDPRNEIYFLIYRKGLLVANGDGSNFREIEDAQGSLGSLAIQSFDVDRNKEGTLYVGTDKGLFRSSDYGKTFTELDIIASSKEFPIRAVTVNPFNSNEILYSAAQAMYKSNDGGEEWSTFRLDTSKVVSDIEFNRVDPNIIFAGFRSF